MKYKFSELKHNFPFNQYKKVYSWRDILHGSQRTKVCKNIMKSLIITVHHDFPCGERILIWCLSLLQNLVWRNSDAHSAGLCTG